MNTALLYHNNLTKYSFGVGHPFSGDRFIAFFNFFESKFDFLKNKLEIIKPNPATDDDLGLVHTEEYLQAIHSASQGVVLLDIDKYVSADNMSPATGYVPEGVEEVKVPSQEISGRPPHGWGKCQDI